jgi:uncharacterized protein
LKITGSETVEAPRDEVFAAICDPAMLLEVIPGCQQITQVGPNEYRAVIALRLPAMVGTYDTWVKLVHAEAPVLGELQGRMVGRTGTISGRAAFALAETEDGTEVEYVGTAVIGGPLARLDSRFTEGLARSIVNEGLNRLSDRLQRVPAAVRG